MAGWVLLSLLAAALLLFLVIRGYFTTLRRYFGTRIVVCPENCEPAAVRVDARDAAESQAFLGKPELHLRACSRWPEKEGCGEECIAQIEYAPDDCLVMNIISQWYEGKNCAFCARPIGPIAWHERPPALRDERGRTVEWKDVPPEHLPDVLPKYAPVCWPCHLFETMRREHPEMIAEPRHPVEQRRPLTPSSAVY